MGRNWHLALQHIKDNLGSVVIIMLELAVVLAIAAVFCASLAETVKKEQLYQALQLDQVAEVLESDLFALPDSVKVINDEKRSFLVDYRNAQYWVESGSAAYFSYFDYALREGSMPDAENTTVIQGIFPDSLKGQFQVGKIYEFLYYDSVIEVLMMGQMKGDYQYGVDAPMLSRMQDSILIYDGGNLCPEPIKNLYVTVLVEPGTPLTAEQNELLRWAREEWAREQEYAKEERGTSMVIGILVLILSLATFAGYNFMQMLQKEKCYGVYYLCGASWKDCVQIQLLVDGITLGIPLCVMSVLLFLYSAFYPSANQEPLLSWEGFVIMACICVLTFLLTSMEGVLRLRGKSPVAIIEKWNQT